MAAPKAARPPPAGLAGGARGDGAGAVGLGGGAGGGGGDVFGGGDGFGGGAGAGAVDRRTSGCLAA